MALALAAFVGVKRPRKSKITMAQAGRISNGQPGAARGAGLEEAVGPQSLRSPVQCVLAGAGPSCGLAAAHGEFASSRSARSRGGAGRGCQGPVRCRAALLGQPVAPRCPESRGERAGTPSGPCGAFPLLGAFRPRGRRLSRFTPRPLCLDGGLPR